MSLAQRLRVDTWAAEAANALRTEGVEPILLKGPAIVTWLYPDEPTARAYGDVDLLVPPASRARAQSVLRSLGYAMQGDLMPELDEPHARSYQRASDNAAIDLHRVLHGMEHVSADVVWRAVSTDTESLSVAGVEVAIPNEVVRTLHLVLHTSAGDGPGSKAWGDLLRGLAQIDMQIWQRAADLARSLLVDGEMGHRLSRVPEAESLVSALGLPRRETDLHAAIRIGRTGSYTPGLISLLQMSSKQGARQRLAYVREKLFPSAAVLRERHPLARRGSRALLVMRVVRVGTCLARLPAAARAWSRERSSEPDDC